MHEENCFLTLTYAEEHLPRWGSLEPRAFPLFMRRLRKRLKGSRRVKYFHCGEYGERTGRPHYHALLFGYDFPDKVVWARRSGHVAWRSGELEELWPLGQSEIGSVTFESAAYVARYVVKKVTGKRAEEHYEVVDAASGEVGRRVPEFATMSRRPGLGASWYEKYHGEVFPADEVIARGVAVKPPRRYAEYLRLLRPEEYEGVVRRRRVRRKRSEESASRLAVREVCTEARLNLFRERDL